MKLAFCLLLPSLALLLTGCPPQGPVCSQGLSRCGEGCADLAADRRHCGGCGLQCGTGEVCQEGQCQCQPGSTRCQGECVVTATDPQHCGDCGKACAAGQSCQASSCACPVGRTFCAGACVLTASDPRHCGGCAGAGGTACAANQVCNGGKCELSCSEPTPTQCGQSCVDLQTNSSHCKVCDQACPAAQSCQGGNCLCPGNGTLCGQSCVDLQADPNHCGRCSRACENGQSCHRGSCTYDLVAACYLSGQVAGIQAESGLRGPLEPLGSVPAALAALEDVLLSADQGDNKLYEAQLSSVNGHAFAPYPTAAQLGQVANHILVDDPYVYVVNAGEGTLQVLQRGPADGGLGLGTVGQLNFGPNTFPEAIAKLGQHLFIPLYGGYGYQAGAGQRVAKVDVSDPKNPQAVSSYDLRALDLKPFDGGSAWPRPFSITAHQGALYVALNNLDEFYTPAGPGMLAHLDPGSGQLTAIDLGAEQCLNPGWVVSDGEKLYVSCQGRADFDPSTWALRSVEQAGVVVLQSQDGGLTSWPMGCPPEPDGGCLPALPSRLAVTAGRVFLGDQNGGRVFALEQGADGGLVGRGAPIQVCPLSPTTGVANVSDVLAVP